MTSNIQIEGLDAALRKVAAVGNMNVVKAGMKQAGVHVKGKIDQYPPGSSANIPGGPGSHWYVRGTGGMYALVGGGISSYGGSEKLSKKWTIKSRKGGMQVVVGNNASYGPYVQGDEQVGFHKARGWKNTDKVAKEESATVNKILAAAIEKALK